LNDLRITPCQSCGKSPGEELCFFRDDLYPFLHAFAQADLVVASSPIYFDTVSAQTKLFIDRCNCFKPLEGYDTGRYEFRQLSLKRRLGLIILVGGERQRFEPALTVIKGFFIWTGVKFAGQLLFQHGEYARGAVAQQPEILLRAFDLGLMAARQCLPTS